MKAKFIFKLPKEEEYFKRSVKATDMAMVLWELTHNTKKGLMYKCEDMPEHTTPEDGVELVFERIYELLEEYDINIDILIG